MVWDNWWKEGSFHKEVNHPDRSKLFTKKETAQRGEMGNYVQRWVIMWLYTWLNTWLYKEYRTLEWHSRPQDRETFRITWMATQVGTTTSENHFTTSSRTTHAQTPSSSNSIPMEMHPSVHQKTCARMFQVVLFMMAKKIKNKETEPK